ncbi:phosphatase PAP2 family protein [Frondihabitans australicus]|uniref:PAP2 superfamily protein n=1 Tax=Frondihabitans australicus TaxID=386892 RepID=A0A495IJ82_9MICO|nr:phosphatase PAP2 family protein [Frondihabitans australicus]RKR75185.1 PAP2 superfamily protein [Frondihabitans australicus]
MRTKTTRSTVRKVAITAVAASFLVATPLAAQAAGTATGTATATPTASATVTPASYPSDTQAPDLVPLLAGYQQLWTPSGKSDLHGTVLNSGVLALNDKLTVWINNNATKQQQFRALQNAEYQTADGTAYDQSVSIADALGSKLAAAYVKGTEDGALPLTTALINSSNGTSGAYVSTGTAKGLYSYPRPYLPSDPATPAVAGDAAGCAPTLVNASSLMANRTGKSYASADGNLNIKRVADTVDTTHEFSKSDVALSAGYASTGICTGGSFPSGHTTTAYQAGITLATILPELAPEILARASEAGNNRIVLGVHYPLDIVGGRIDGEAALAKRWSDPAYVKGVLLPARAELVKYLQTSTGLSLSKAIKTEKAYADNPYGGKTIPGGSAQIVNNRASAVSVYTERLTYGFPKTGVTGAKASVPAGAENLLITTFPTLTAAQRASVLAQTEIASGYPLDQTGSDQGSWERLNLAAATSATVLLSHNGQVKVIATGGTARVVKNYR